MKNFLTVLVLTGILLSASIPGAKADWKDKELYTIKPGKSDNQKFLKDYKIAKKQFDIQRGAQVLDFYVDLQLGYGMTNASVNSAGSTGAYNTDPKGGINLGALFFLNLFDVLQFSSGLDFINKKFEVNPPTFTTPVSGIDTNTSEISAQYLNIPFNFNYGGMISDKFGLTFNGGPYFGLLLSAEEDAGLGYKDFDLGLNGTLTANYLIAPFTSVLLGTKMQYGGLNNLGKTEQVESVRTFNYTFFTGVRFGL